MQHLEIELKFKIQEDQLEDIQSSIESLGYISQWRKYEKTSMYDNRDFIMQKTNWRVRLRISWDHYELCYKKPIQDDSGIKKEIEYETVVGDADTTSKILNTMDFYEVSSYERYRTIYTHKNNTIKITIDEFPFSTFVEIEWDEWEIKSVAQELWFDFSHNLVKPCDTLFNEWRRSQGLEEKMIMSFDSYDQA